MARESRGIESIYGFMRLLFSSEGKKRNIFREECYIFDIVSPGIEFRTGVSEQKWTIEKKKKKREGEREDETKRRKRLKKKKWPQWKSGVAEFRIKFEPFARDWYRKCSSQGKLVGVDSPDNFFPTPFAFPLPPSPPLPFLTSVCYCRVTRQDIDAAGYAPFIRRNF